MKVLLLVSLMMFGVALSKPSMEGKLVDLLRELLEKQEGNTDAGNGGGGQPGAGAGPAITTMMGPDELPPFFGDELNLSGPLDASNADAINADAVERFGSIKGTLQEIYHAIADYSSADSSISEYLNNTVFPQFEDRDELIFEPLFVAIYAAMLQGAIMGTQNEDNPEPLFSLTGDEDKDFRQVLLKSYILEVANERALSESYDMLYADTEAGVLQACDTVFNVIMYKPVEEVISDDDLAWILQADLVCIVENMKVLLDRFNNNNILPEDAEVAGSVKRQGGQQDPPPAPGALRRLIRVNVLTSHFVEAVYWFAFDIGMIFFENGFEYEERNVKTSIPSLKRGLENSRYINHKSRYLANAKKQQKKKSVKN